MKCKSGRSRGQSALLGVMAFSLVLLICLVLSDIAVRTAVKTNENRWEAEMERIAIAASNDLVLNPDGGMLYSASPDDPAELNDHLLDKGLIGIFPTKLETLREKWRTESCDVGVKVKYVGEKDYFFESEPVTNRDFGKLVFKRAVAIREENGERKPGVVEIAVAC